MPALLSVLGPNHLPAIVLFAMLEAFHCLWEAAWPLGLESNPDGLIQGSVLDVPSFLLSHSHVGRGEGATHCLSAKSIIPEEGCAINCFPIKMMITVSSVQMDPGRESEIRPRPVRGYRWEKLSLVKEVSL